MEVVRKGQGVLVKIAKYCSTEPNVIINTQFCRCFASKASFGRGQQGKDETPAPAPAPEIGNAGRKKAEKISFAMKAYLERAQEHDAFMQSELKQYELGKRHLANIMSLDVDNMTQADVDKAIEYLLPSGLFDRNARPKMTHPEEYIPQRKAAQFSADGRPFHSKFYTGCPNYYDKMHQFALLLQNMND